MMHKLLKILPIFLLYILAVGGVRTVYTNHSQSIALKPLLLDPSRPAINHVGNLKFLGAWELTSNNADFGGISALTALPDGRFVGLSDAGTIIGFGLKDNLQADRPFIAPLPGSRGLDTNYEDRDSEGLAYDPATRRFWVSYESKSAIRRFSPSLARMEAIVRPAAMKKWPKTSGPEAMERLPDGRFIVFSEGYDRGDATYQALMFSGDPVEAGTISFAFRYRPPTGYKPTDAKMMPDGRLLVLNRRISIPEGFTAIVSVLNLDIIRKDETVVGQAIATLKPPLLVDNMEGLAVTQEQGKTIIWLISDNNFFYLQRTILMKFALHSRIKKPEEKPAPGFDSLY